MPLGTELKKDSYMYLLRTQINTSSDHFTKDKIVTVLFGKLRFELKSHGRLLQHLRTTYLIFIFYQLIHNPYIHELYQLMDSKNETFPVNFKKNCEIMAVTDKF